MPAATVNSKASAGDALESVSAARAISCLLIVAFHIAQFLTSNGRHVQFLFAQTPGIHVFMVISGFILVYVVREDDTPTRLMARRLARLLPLYWLLTTAALFLALWRPWLLPEADVSLGSVLASYGIWPHFDVHGAVQPILFVGWMLNYIIPLNLLFAASLIFPIIVRPLVVTLAIVMVMAGSQFMGMGALRTFWSDPTPLEFAAGLFVGTALKRPRVAAWLRAHQVWPLAVLALGALVLVSLTSIEGPARVLICGALAAVGVFAVGGHEMYHARLHVGVLEPLGQMSYSIYLLHPLLIPVLGGFIISRIGPPNLEIALMFLTTFAATILGANFLYLWFERPTNDWLRRKLRVTPKLSNG